MALILRRHAAAFCLLALAGAVPALAESTTTKARKKKSATKANSGAGSRGVRLKPSPATTYANGDTPAERQRHEEARLRRECKGRPNSGACLGYAN